MRFLVTTVRSQEGSIIVIALLLLVLMTIVGISGSNTAVTESFIVRNTGIYQQNVSLAEAAALEIAQDALINLRDAEARMQLTEYSPQRRDYIIDIDQWESSGKRDDWYAFGTANMGRVIDDPDNNPATFPQYVAPSANLMSDSTLIDDVRGEALNSLRVALVGWDVKGGYGIGLTGVSESSAMREARILAEYASPNFGLTRLEVGIKREF